MEMENCAKSEFEGLVDGQIMLTEEELAFISVKDFNILIRDLPEGEKLELKRKRRTIKNRSYAQTSRSKRSQQKTVLEKEKVSLSDELANLKEENAKLKQERDEARIKLEALERFAALSGIAVVFDNSRNSPYNVLNVKTEPGLS